MQLKSLLIIFMFLLSISFVSAITKDDIFTNLQENLPNGQATFNVTVPGAANINFSLLKLTFNEVCGNVTSYNFYVGTWVTYGNISNGTNLTTQYEYVLNNTLGKGKQSIRIIANIQDAVCSETSTGYTFGHKIDWIPCVNYSGVSYCQTSWAWWNSTTNTDYTNTSTYWSSINNGSSTVSINSDGTLSLGMSNTTLCYQETANISTACGGLATGTYTWAGNWWVGAPISNLFDGDYTTGSFPNGGKGWLNTTYMKPFPGARIIYWQTRDGGASNVNRTINESCQTAYSDRWLLSVYIDADTTNGYYRCDTGSGWTNIVVTSGDANLREEAIFFSTPNTSANMFYSKSVDINSQDVATPTYKFDFETGNATSISNTANQSLNGTGLNIAVSNGFVGNGLNITSSTTSHIVLPTVIGKNNYSLSCYIKPYQLGNAGNIVSQRNTASGQALLAFRLAGTNALLMQVRNDAGTIVQTTGVFVLPLNTWNWVGFTYNANTENMTMFVNGTPDKSWTNTVTGVFTLNTEYVGNDYYDAALLNGTIDRCRVWHNKVLSYSDIQTQYNYDKTLLLTNYTAIIPNFTTSNPNDTFMFSANNGVSWTPAYTNSTNGGSIVIPTQGNLLSYQLTLNSSSSIVSAFGVTPTTVYGASTTSGTIGNIKCLYISPLCSASVRVSDGCGLIG